MQTVTNSRSRVQHYASYLVGGEEVYGTATLVAGGYSFRPDGECSVRLVSYKDSNLMLYGRCDLADQQHAADKAQWAEEGFSVWQGVA